MRQPGAATAGGAQGCRRNRQVEQEQQRRRRFSGPLLPQVPLELLLPCSLRLLGRPLPIAQLLH